MIEINSFIHPLKKNKIDVSIGDEFIVNSYKHKVNEAAILVALENWTLCFYIKSNNTYRTIKVTELSNYKIIKDNVNYAPGIFNMIFYDALQLALDDIYEKQLKNIHYLCLNDYFGELISRYKLIMKEIRAVYFKANMRLEVTKDKQYVLKWDTLI